MGVAAEEIVHDEDRLDELEIGLVVNKIVETNHEAVYGDTCRENYFDDAEVHPGKWLIEIEYKPTEITEKAQSYTEKD